jgi:predicted RNA-binding Zn-ribbon protein involved in translation (DUF1610 family)
MCREHSRASRDDAGFLDHNKVPALWGSAGLPALRDFSGAIVVEAASQAGTHGGWTMTPRFKGVPQFDLSQLCPLCGYRIQPRELIRLASHTIRCPKCGDSFDEMAGKRPVKTP